MPTGIYDRSNWKPWNTGLTKETNKTVAKIAKCNSGNIPWNRGLTKKTDKRVAKIGKKTAKRLTGKKHPASCICGYCKDDKIPWNKNLTKQNHPSLKQVSVKMCGEKNPRFGMPTTKHDIDTCKCLRCKALRGETRGKNNLAYIAYQKLTPNEKSLLNNRKFDKAKHFPNKKEMLLFSIVDSLFPGEYKLNVGSKTRVDGLKPDIIHKKKKKVIEHLGIYWHKGRRGNTKSSETRKKKNRYKKCGYNCLTVWEDDLIKRPEKIVNKVIKFHNQKEK